jgi:hypothetical protein
VGVALSLEDRHAPALCPLRRALVVAATALVAVTPGVEAKKKKPLAFAGVVVTGITSIGGGEAFRWAFDVAVALPGPSVTGFSDTLDVATGAPTDRVRAEIAEEVKRRVSEIAEGGVQDVPPGRVAVA